MRGALESVWYNSRLGGLALLPLSGVYALLSHIDASNKQKQSKPFKKPVIVVGNITVGGTGKTPIVIALVEYLKQKGLKAGVVSRGYGGSESEFPHLVSSGSKAELVGDEPLLIARRCECPVVIDPQRSRAVTHLIEYHDVDIVISDDGLQHHAMHRDIELCVIDAQRGLGNGLLLPAGPLREGAKRLQSIDAVIVNGQSGQNFASQQFQSNLAAQAILPLGKSTALPEKGARVHAVAGIGNPQRFFDTLKSLGYEVVEHAFGDHHAFTDTDLRFAEDLPVIMTEKDAVKCEAFSQGKSLYYLPVRAELPEGFWQFLDKKLEHIQTLKTENT